MSKRLKLLTMIPFIGIGLLLLGYAFLEHSSTITLSQVILRHHWLFTLWRYGWYIILLILWPYFIGMMAKRQQWSAHTIHLLTHQRFKLLGLFAIIEIFWVHNLLGHCLSLG